MKSDSEEDNIKKLTELAENGDIKSQYLLGCWHCNVAPAGLSDIAVSGCMVIKKN
jgi:hypothetical protein